MVGTTKVPCPLKNKQFSRKERKNILPRHNADSPVQTIICKAQSVYKCARHAVKRKGKKTRRERERKNEGILDRRDDIYNPIVVRERQFFSLPLYRQTLNIIQVLLENMYRGQRCVL